MPGLCGNICQAAGNLFQAAGQAYQAVRDPHDAVGKMLVPNQARLIGPAAVEEHKKQALKVVQELGGEILRPKTEDGLELDALFFKGIHPLTKQKREKVHETIVIFGGLGGHHYQSRTLIEQYQKRGCNVLVFNYRGIGTSDGKTTRDGIIKDSCASIDYLHGTHNVPHQKIAVHGISFGGGPSSRAAALRKGVGAVNERSYSKISAAAPHFINKCMPHLGLAQGCAGYLSGPAIVQTGWEFDSAENWPQITGKKIVVHHPKDDIICTEAGLFQAIHGKDRDTLFISFEENEQENPHGRALGDKKVDRIVQTLFPELQKQFAPTVRKSLWGRIKQLFHDFFTFILHTFRIKRRA